MLFFLSSVAFLVLISLFAFRYRERILSRIPDRFIPRLNHYQPLSTFAEQIGAGMSSADFDLEANVRDGDSRTGLDESASMEISGIMKRERVNFDQARLIRQNRILAQNGIDPSGMPLDSKAVTRL